MTVVRSQPTLWVIDPSLEHPEDQGIEQILRPWPGASRVFRPGLRPGDGPGPESGYDVDGIVLMGSAASVLDDHPWMRPLEAWLRPLLEGELRIPVLGICFGHQMIAHVARGRVDWVDPDRRKIVGVESTHLGGGRLIRGEHQLRVVVSHREVVKVAPAEYRVTASRVHSPVDGLEHESLPVFSYQFHPEAREEFARRAGIRPEAIDDRLRADSDRVLAAFVGQVRGAGR